jgi:hypothetical protein
LRLAVGARASPAAVFRHRSTGSRGHGGDREGATGGQHGRTERATVEFANGKIARWEYETPLHELVDICRQQGLALDFAVYGPDEGQHPDSDDTKSTYLGGSRITGYKGDPMDVIRAAIRARRDA